MRRGRLPAAVTLSKEERRHLTSLAYRSRSAPQLARRARIVLACADGQPTTGIARRLRVSPTTVCKWRSRFLAARVDGLADNPRPGAPRRITDAQVEDVVARTLGSPPPGATHWSTRAMARATGLSHATISRIWRAFGLQPHRADKVAPSPDPRMLDRMGAPRRATSPGTAGQDAAEVALSRARVQDYAMATHATLPAPPAARILILHRDPAALRDLSARVRGLGHAVRRGAAAANEEVDLALVDLEPDGRGIEDAARIADGIPVVYLVGDVTDDVLARTTGAAGYVVKPIGDRQLRLTMQAALAVQGETAALRRRAALLESAFDNVADGLAVTDADGRFVKANRVAAEMMRFDPPAAEGEDPNRWSETRDVFEADERTPLPFSAAPLARALAGESVSGFEIFVRGKASAAGRHVAVDARPLRDDGDRLRGALIALRDVTRQHRADADLARTLDEVRHQRELLEGVFDGMSDGVAVFDAGGRFLMLNAPGRRMAGVEPGQDINERLSRTVDFRHADDMRPMRPEERPQARVLRGETFDNLDICIPVSRGNDLYLRASGKALRNPDGTLRGGITIFSDVSEARARERELRGLADSLREQKEAMDAVFENMADGVISIDRRGQVVNVNARAARMLGIAPSEFDKWMAYDGVVFSSNMTPVPLDQHPLVRALRGESINDLRVFVRHDRLPDGVHASVSTRPLMGSGDTPTGAVAVFRDVTAIHEAEEARRQAADELRRQNQFMEMVFESISDGVVVADAEGKLTMANGSAQRMVRMGLTDGPPDTWSATYGTFFPDTVTPCPTEDLPLARALRGGVSNDVGLFIRNPQLPKGVHVSVNGRPMRNPAGEVEGGVITMRDVTQQVHAREALQQAFAHGRLEVVETVLHNIGNAINSVAVGIGTVRERFRRNKLLDRFRVLAQMVSEHEDDWIPWLEGDPQGRQVRAFILSLAKDFAEQNERTLRTVDRVQGRVRHIVDIIETQDSSNSGTVERKVVELRTAIADAARLLEESLGKRGIALDIDCSRAPAELRIQESRFHQTLVNLIKNAMEAIDKLADTGGLEGRPRIRVVAYAQDDQLVLDVIDNGIGIDPEEQRSIFVAGYTTKKKGSGLGLHAAANFARESGGEVRPLSDGVGRGTTMRLTLRLAAPPTSQDQRMA